MFSVSLTVGLDAMMRSLAIFPEARNPLARALAILPAPIKPTDVTFADMVGSNTHFFVYEMSVVFSQHITQLKTKTFLSSQ